LRLVALESRIAPAIVSRGDRNFTDGEILVKLVSDDPLFAFTGRVVADRLGGIFDLDRSEFLFRRDTEARGVIFAALQPGVSPETAINALRGRPGIEAAEPNWVSVIPAEGFPQDSPPDDPLYSKQWHLAKMQVDKAWTITTGSPNVVVAVLDDGLPTTHQHEDLQKNRWRNPFEIEGDGLDQDFNHFADDTLG
jgi:hypothetical protein